MADKKAIVVLAPEASLTGSGANIGKLFKKGSLLKCYTAGTVLDGSVAEADLTRCTPEQVAEAIEKGTPLLVVDLGAADSAALDAALGVILDGADRRTVIAVAGKDALALYGTGIDKAGALDREAFARDILPTLAVVAEFSLTREATGAVLYQALKNPNPKLEEILKLKEALSRMEGALARDNREPWDKHDCA